MIAYKLFKVYKDKTLHPLYIGTKEVIPIGEWVYAQSGPRTPNGKVKSKLGELAYRPGLHCTEVPLADHIGKRQSDGSLWQGKDTVWCEVEIPNNDLTGYIQDLHKDKPLREQYFRGIPVDGYYWYQTNASAKVRWLIAGKIKVNKILSDNEVVQICLKAGVRPQPVEKRDQNLPS